MSPTQSLPAVVDALEDKTRKHKQAENTQYHVSVAEHNIREVNQELDKLLARLREVKYYKTILEDAFGGDAPTMLGGSTKDAKKIANISQTDLLDYVQSDEVEGEVDLENDGNQGQPTVRQTPDVQKHITQIERVNKQLKNIRDTIVQDLEKRRDEWNTKISAAEELQKIIDASSSDFSQTLNRMHRLLTREMLSTDGEARSVVVQWERAIEKWEEHQSLQSLDDFQEKHGLSDDTIDDIERLSRSEKPTLADVSLDNLKEMKDVDELASAIILDFQSGK